MAIENPLEFPDTTRREVLRKAVFVAPVILTLPVIPSFAMAGSDSGDDRGERGDQDEVTTSGNGSPSERRRRRRHHWWFFNW